MELFLGFKSIKLHNLKLCCCFKDHRSSISVTLETSRVGFFRDELVPAHILSQALCCRTRTWWAPDRPPTVYRTFQRSRTAVSTPTIFRLSPSLLMRAPKFSFDPFIPANYFSSWDLSVKGEGEWVHAQVPPGLTPTANYLKASREGTWVTAPASEHEVAKWAGSPQAEVLRGLCVLFLTFCSLLMLKRWVRKRPLEPEAVRKPNKDWVNIGPKNSRLNFFLWDPQITLFTEPTLIKSELDPRLINLLVFK